MKWLRRQGASGGRLELRQLAADFRGLDPNDPGAWPLAPRVVVCVVLLVLVVTATWWFDWRDQAALIERRQVEEQQLRAEWTRKKREAVNLEAYERQLAEADRQFGVLLRQLPNRAEMDSLLADINQAGLGRGLMFELFRPGDEVVRDFYAEMPIEIRVVGSYHDLGAFASDVAQMPRIVTLSNLVIDKQSDNLLTMNARATTYRYLEDDELAAQQGGEGARRGRR